MLNIANLTLLEAMRRKLLPVVGVLTLVAISLTCWGFERLIHVKDGSGHSISRLAALGATSGLEIFLAFIFSFTVAISGAFLAAPALAADIESGIALAILPRPIARRDFVLGRFIGLAILLVTYVSVAAGLEFFLVGLIVGYVPPHPVIAIAYLAAQGVAMLAFALFLSSQFAAITAGVIALALFGVAWIAGIVEQVGAALHNAAMVNGGTIVNLVFPTDGLWRGTIYALEPTVMLTAVAANPDRGGPFAVIAPPTPQFLVWTAAWIAVMIVAAVLSFRARDL